MVMYVLFGGMLANTWEQIIKALRLLSGASLMALMVMKAVNFVFGSLFAEAAAIWFFSVSGKSNSTNVERERFSSQFVCSQTGLGSNGAVAH